MKEKDPVFKRHFENSLYENDHGGITVIAHMFDIIHDIKITLDVSLPDFIISNANLEIAKAPGGRCQELCPRITELNGRPLKHGFTQFVRDLYAGSEGCPNIVNMLLTSVPLAINTSWMIAMKHGLPTEDIKTTQKAQMKDVCISSKAL
ncbi:MAG: DUF2889 domain-containing protein [FCB group bacterium]|nr:DUF2889 domain-containing protein [FCB group bacterium]